MCSALSAGFAWIRLVAGFPVLPTSSTWSDCPPWPTAALIKVPIVIEQKGGIFCFYEKHVSHFFLNQHVTISYYLYFSQILPKTSWNGYRIKKNSKKATWTKSSNLNIKNRRTDTSVLPDINKYATFQYTYITTIILTI